MARPTKKNPEGKQKSPKLTEDTIRKLEEAFSIDASVKEACYYADISTDTFYRWIKEYPKLSYKLERLREKPVLKARQTVVKSLDNPDYAFKYLERKKKDEFSPRQELTGKDGKALIPEQNEQDKADQAINIYLDGKRINNTGNNTEEKAS